MVEVDGHGFRAGGFGSTCDTLRPALLLQCSFAFARAANSEEA